MTANPIIEYQLDSWVEPCLEQKVCLDCRTPLNNSNWYGYNRIHSKYLCKRCHTRRTLQYRKKEGRYYRERKYRQKIRMMLLEILGGKCVRCGESDWRCLQIDHVKGNGFRERKTAKSKGMNYTLQLLRRVQEGKGSQYQLLCANCNFRKRYENHEWRRKNQTLEDYEFQLGE